ncbi:MAG: hypothetical protein SNG20_04185 [Rikenellaceae bacterium]
MRRNIITISEGGMVTIPSGVIRMSVNEIALLFEVMLPTVRGRIKALHNSRAERTSMGEMAEVVENCISLYGIITQKIIRIER